MSTVVEVWLDWNAYVSEFQLQIYILFHAAVISGYFIVAIRNSCTYVAFTQHYCYNCNARAFGYQSVSALMAVNGYQCTRLFIYLAVLIYQIIWSWQLYMHRKIEPSQYLSFWVAVILSSGSWFLHFGSFLSRKVATWNVSYVQYLFKLFNAQCIVNYIMQWTDCACISVVEESIT